MVVASNQYHKSKPWTFLPVDDYFCNRLGSLFEHEPTAETFGITALPSTVLLSYGIRPSSSPVNSRGSFTPAELLRLSIMPLIVLPQVVYSSGDFMYRFLAPRNDI